MVLDRGSIPLRSTSSYDLVILVFGVRRNLNVNPVSIKVFFINKKGEKDEHENLFSETW